MLKAFANCLKVPELRNRIVITLGLLFVARVGANIPLPGLDPDVLANIFKQMTTGANSAAVTTFNLFTGGAMLKGAVFALGVMPYISAQIIMQLMGAVVPTLAKLNQEGEIGRQKVAQYTRYLTIIIATVQGLLMLMAMCDPNKAASVFNLQGSAHAFDNLVVIPHAIFVPLGLCLLVSGSMIVLWLGEQLTDRGIGNGTSILITIGILADIPGALRSFAAQMGTGQIGAGDTTHYTWVHAVGMVLLFTLVTCAMVAVNQAVRRIPIQYAKRIIGKKIYGGQSSYLPLKLTYAGVMPVIFAGAITTFPPMLIRPLAANVPMFSFLADFANYLDHGVAMQSGGGHAWVFYSFYSILIFGFSYFWVSMMFKPVQIADDLKKASGFVPGIRPGNDTAKFINFVMSRLTLVGSITLLIIALMPDFFIVKLGFYPRLASFLGGTGGLITVGVVLDTMRQVETMLLQRQYEGFLTKGRFGGIATKVAPSRKVVDFGDKPAIGALGYTCLAIFIAGSVAGLYGMYGR